MKGEWVQAASGTWHLVWGQSLDEDQTITSWCNREFRFDEPTKSGAQIVGYEDILHDECMRKSEEL